MNIFPYQINLKISEGLNREKGKGKGVPVHIMRRMGEWHYNSSHF